MTVGFSENCAAFEYSGTERGISVTRVFQYDPDSIIEKNDKLPIIGEALSAGNPNTALIPSGIDYTLLTCRQISSKALAGYYNKVEYTCNYTNEPVDKAIFIKQAVTYAPTPIDELPVTIEYGGEYLTINPQLSVNSSEWQWESDGLPILQIIGKKVNSSVIKFTRYVRQDKFQHFNDSVKYLTGLLNKYNDPFGTVIKGGSGCFMFDGASTEMFRNYYNEIWWKAELTFLSRDPDGLNVDGWQKTLRLDGFFDIAVKNSDGTYMYEEGDFSALFDDTQTPY